MTVMSSCLPTRLWKSSATQLNKTPALRSSSTNASCLAEGNATHLVSEQTVGINFYWCNNGRRSRDSFPEGKVVASRSLSHEGYISLSTGYFLPAGLRLLCIWLAPPTQSWYVRPRLATSDSISLHLKVPTPPRVPTSLSSTFLVCW